LFFPSNFVCAVIKLHDLSFGRQPSGRKAKKMLETPPYFFGYTSFRPWGLLFSTSRYSDIFFARARFPEHFPDISGIILRHSPS
jgi:hypothetical protein